MNEYFTLIENDKQINALVEQNKELFHECFELIYSAESADLKAYLEKTHEAIELKAKHSYKSCAVGDYYQTKHCIYKRIK